MSVNPTILIGFFSALLFMVLAQPLIQGKVKPNDWYGVRIPAAFESEEAWFDINRYGGRLLSKVGLLLMLCAVTGFFVDRAGWRIYNLAMIVVTFGCLGWCIFKIFRYGRARGRP